MPWKRPISSLCLLLLLGGAVACATGGSTAPMVDPERRFQVRVSWADQSETVDLREGETATLERPEATYRVTPSVAGAPVGKAQVLVVRETPEQQVQARLLLVEGESMELSQTLGTPWPELTVRLTRVRPRLPATGGAEARDVILGGG